MISGAKPWHRVLLEQPVEQIDLAALALEVQREGREHQDNAAAPSESQDAEMDRWYDSSIGQATLKSLVEDVWWHLERVASHAMPAHDRRHAIHKVPLSAICYVAAEGVRGYQTLGVLGALLHDYGRWAEERLYGAPGPGVIHARFSYLLAREVLEAHDLPDYVRSHLLLGPLNHSSGAVPSDPMIQKVTVSADREQLYGPEIVLRLAHHGVGDNWDMASFYGEKRGTPILDRLKHFHDNRLPGPLFARDAWLGRLRGQLRDFVLIAESLEASKSRWVGVSSSKFTSPLNEEQHLRLWEAAQQSSAATFRDISPVAAFEQLLDAKHVAPSHAHRKVALDKLSELAPENCERLSRALQWIDAERLRNDADERALVSKALSSRPDDLFLHRLTALVSA